MADLPPSSRKTRVRVCRALLHDPLPHGGGAGERDQVDLGRDGQLFADEVVRRGHDVENARGEVGLLGHEAAQPSGVPRRVGGRLEDDRVARRESLAQLVQRDLDGEVPRHDRADDPDRLLPHLPGVGRAPPVDRLGQIGAPVELVDQLDRVPQGAVERDVELVCVGGHARAPHLEDQLLAQGLPVLLERVLQLGQALLAPRAVGRPVGLVEGAPRRVDGAVHLVGRRVGHLPDNLLGGGVDVVERLARVGADELAVDEHPLFVVGCSCHRHSVSRGFSLDGNRIIKKRHEHNRPVRPARRRSQSGKAAGNDRRASTSAPSWRVSTVPAPRSWSSTSTRRTWRCSGCSVVKPMPARTC